MIFEISHVGLVAAHQQTDAVVDAGENKLRLSRAQAFSAPAAERVSQQDGVEAVAIRSVDAFLQVWAHLDAKIVQPHGNILHFDGVGTAGDCVLHFTREHLANDRLESHG